MAWVCADAQHSLSRSRADDRTEAPQDEMETTGHRAPAATREQRGTVFTLSSMPSRPLHLGV